jgi:phospholipase C
MFNASPPATAHLTVTDSGTGTGTVTSTPAGISCGQTCSASFAVGTPVTLTANPGAGSIFTGWTGACSGTAPCSLTLQSDTTVGAILSAAPAPTGLATLNHIIFLSQENRSFDHYAGALRKYWSQHGYPDQSFDGLPQFNPTSGAAPLAGPAPTNPGCNPNQPPPADCAYDTSNPVTSFHLVTQCVENPSPSWNESHIDWDYYDLVGLSAAKLDGFVYSAAHDARNNQPPFFDTNGLRAMGYYDGTDLNYFYFMASTFGTSDRFFSPTMSRTHPNREYLVAGTSGGYVYPEGTDAQDTPQLKQTTIFQELQNAGISWKIYVDPTNSGCAGPPYQASCLINLSYISNFTFAQTIVSQYPQNIAPIAQYFTDLQNGTLPQVVQIEPATDEGFDEHPTTDDASPSNLQLGAQFVASIINALMQSSAWKDSAFILTFDEAGGFYDHIAPQPAVSPDGIKPVDLLPNDICTTTTGPTCDFVYTGYRLPLLVVSPYAKKNYVDHTVADTTAILKLIETRFKLPALTKRDAIQPDMTEFFDFTNPPWITPPIPPAQTTSGPCYVDHLP